MKTRERIQSLAPAARHGRLLLKTAFILILIVSFGHLVLGAHPLVVLMGGSAALFSVLPIAYLGIFNVAAILIGLVGFRYVGFPLFAKLAMGQPLDSFLLDPAGSFGAVSVGVAGYLIAFVAASNLSIGRPLLQHTAREELLGSISFLAAVIGIAANLVFALRAGEAQTDITVAKFFVAFIHLALITAIARSVVASNLRKSVDLWVVVILIAEIVFGMVRNSRMALMETFMCFVVTVSAFEYRIRWRHFALVATFIGLMVIFVTPIFLYVRSFRNDLSWTGRIGATIDASANWPQAFSDFLRHRDLKDRLGWYLNYYGSPQNVFERMSNINHVDVLKAGADSHAMVGLEDLGLAIERAMPRILAPNKPLGYSQGHWLYKNIGISNPGPYATAPLIGTGYAALGWMGAFFYPLLLGFAWLLFVKKICGWNLQGNIWAIYLLLRVHNQFVEGSSDSYLLHIFRSLPQDFVLLWIVDTIARGRFLHPWRRESVQIYGK